jgi:hypothetical protein
MAMGGEVIGTGQGMDIDASDGDRMRGLLRDQGDMVPGGGELACQGKGRGCRCRLG